VTLIGEAGVSRGPGQRQPVFDRSSGEGEAAQRSVAVRAGAEGAAEVAGEREAVASRDLLEGRSGCLFACVGSEVVTRELSCPDVDRDRAALALAPERAEDVGEGCGCFGTGSATNGSAPPSSASRMRSGAM
jgi:hypothetical protein